MSPKILLSSLFCLLLIAAIAQTKDNPKTLALNGSGGGIIASSTSTQWWQVTTNADGALVITIQSPVDKDNRYKLVSWTLYDHDKTHNLIYGSNDPIRFGNPGSYAFDGLTAGTYYIQVGAQNPSDTSDHTAYTLSDTLIKPVTPNDTEPDSTRSQALMMPLNGSVKGHVGYLYNNHRDTIDWYKVTTDKDGYLRLTINNEITTQHYNNVNFSHNGGLDVSILDHDGKTTLKAYSSDFGYPFVFGVDGLAPGTYYVTVHPRGAYQLNGADGGGYYYSTTNFTPYTISDSLFKPSITNDAEPDSNVATALTLPLNGSVNGHIGYYYNHYLDTADFYKININNDGKLTINITPAQTQANNQPNNLALQCWLYDKDGVTQLNYANAGANSQLTMTTDGLAPGTYYVRIQSFNNYTDLDCCGGSFDTRLGFGPYTISNTLTLPLYTSDKEPDSTFAQANMLPLNSSATGSVNYYYNHHKDSVDVFKIVLPQDGMLRLKVASVNNVNVYKNLYGADGVNYYSNDNQYDSYIDGLAAGTYYLKISTVSQDQFASYQVNDSLFTYKQSAEHEPDSFALQANEIAANKTATGHIGFYGNGTDYTDWFKVNYTGINGGTLKLTYQLYAHLFNEHAIVNFEVFRDTSAGNIADNNLGYTDSVPITISNAQQGYYWIKVTDPEPTERVRYGIYSITDSFQSILPLTLTSFKGEQQKNTVALHWQTVSEINTASFEVQRSNNTIDFTPIGKVAAAGNSNTTRTYNFIDAAPFSGYNYYRLKMMDKNGAYTYSDIVAINITNLITSIKIFPNPVVSALVVQSPQNAEVKITDAGGRILYHQMMKQENGGLLTIDASKLKPGLYFVSLVTDGKQTTKTFVKQ